MIFIQVLLGKDNVNIETCLILAKKKKKKVKQNNRALQIWYLLSIFRNCLYVI